MRNIGNAPEAIKTWRIICAAQSEPDWSENRQILAYAGDSPCDNRYILIDGGHCSCYDWHDVDWDATEYTYDELAALAPSKVSGTGCYSKSERMFWIMVCCALGINADFDLEDCMAF